VTTARGGRRDVTAARRCRTAQVAVGWLVVWRFAGHVEAQIFEMATGPSEVLAHDGEEVPAQRTTEVSLALEFFYIYFALIFEK
jgi:hypothetical protein